MQAFDPGIERTCDRSVADTIARRTTSFRAGANAAKPIGGGAQHARHAVPLRAHSDEVVTGSSKEGAPKQ
ncbi:predicted metal-dependent hydrolase [Methylorubrum populi]|uniref:Predicted metal-dependent hydrolase n=1 Tax=Methylorubrum populi TaxID=223967 RepID=A0A160PC78_9HYPH|nr:hypothetical protein [Methylorubrum populi]BAU89895.1 predicted metal-dependent hydrolase [Methylorubrum populi]